MSTPYDSIAREIRADRRRRELEQEVEDAKNSSCYRDLKKEQKPLSYCRIVGRHTYKY
ncbi:hypothetical protein ABMB67_004726 [Halalkalibacter oceani]